MRTVVSRASRRNQLVAEITTVVLQPVSEKALPMKLIPGLFFEQFVQTIMCVRGFSQKIDQIRRQLRTRFAHFEQTLADFVRWLRSACVMILSPVSDQLFDRRVIGRRFALLFR